MKEKFYIVRCDKSGAFAGEIAERNGTEVTMKNARCIWYWNGAASLLQLAREAVKNPDKCRYTAWVDELILLDAIEIIPCTEEAEKSIKEVPEWRIK